MSEKKNSNSKARIEANNRYNAKAYDRINIAVPKGAKALAEQYALDTGLKTVNALMNFLLRRELGFSSEAWKAISYTPPEDKQV